MDVDVHLRWQWWMMMMMVDDGWWWWWWMMMSTKEESGHLVIETGKSRTGRGNQETVKGRVKATKSILWLNSQKLFSDKVYIAFSPPFIRTLLTSIIQPNIIQHYPPQSSTRRSWSLWWVHLTLSSYFSRRHWALLKEYRSLIIGYLNSQSPFTYWPLGKPGSTWVFLNLKILQYRMGTKNKKCQRMRLTSTRVGAQQSCEISVWKYWRVGKIWSV